MQSSVVNLLDNFIQTGPHAKTLIKAYADGNTALAPQILASIGISKPTAQDLQDLKTYAQNYSTLDTQEQQDRDAKLKKIKTIMTGSPKEIAIKAAILAAAEGSKIAGDVLANDANKLASAILARSRTNSVRQNELFGPSRTEKAGEAWAAERQRRGGRAQIIGNGIGNALEMALGIYNTGDTAARTMIAGSELSEGHLPSAAWNYVNSASQAVKKNKPKS